MSLSDLHIRIRRRVHSSVSRARYRLGLPTLPTGPVRLNRQFHHLIDGGARNEILARYRELFPLAVQAELEEADRLLNHHFRLLGHTMVHPGEIAWALDPVSGVAWGSEFSLDISYRGPDRLGDIKLPWELAKHQYFFTLGKAGWLSGDSRYAVEIRDQIEHWMDANPCHRGIHWISALESGTRVLSWILSYPFFKEYCDEPFRVRMAHSIAQHLLFIEQNISDGEFANTHLAGEAAILAIGGMFVTCKRSDHWISLGLSHLDAQAHRQVHGDGMHAEQSIAYHRYFLDQYYLVDAFLMANGRSLSQSAIDRTEQMTSTLMSLLFPDGSAPAFGDCDDARGIWCRADCPRDYASLLVLGAVRFKRGDFKYVARGLTEEVLWLYGPEGIDAFTSIPALEPARASIGLPDSGYYMLRAGWRRTDGALIFDCGPLGRGAAGHGHADALSIQLNLGGYNFLVDPGTYSYNLDYHWRQYFRSTGAHNSVTVDGLDQSVQGDRMSWTSSAATRCRRWSTTPEFDLVDGEHDGYMRLAGPVSHRRVIVFLKPDIWFLWDLLDSPAEHEAELAFHLRPDCMTGSVAVSGALELRSPDGHVLFIHGPPGTTHRSSEAWHSDEYGQRSSTRVLSYQRSFKGPTALAMVLATTPELPWVVRADATSLTITPSPDSNATVTLFYRISEDAWHQDNRISFNGDLLYFDDQPADSAVIHAEHFTLLAYGDDVEIRSGTHITQAHLRTGRLTVTLARDQREPPVIRVPPEITVVIEHLSTDDQSTSTGPGSH